MIFSIRGILVAAPYLESNVCFYRHFFRLKINKLGQVRRKVRRMTQKYLTLSRHGIYYFQYWIPKSLNNDVYQKKLLRFSLKTSIKREAEKLSYKLISLIYDLEEQFINSPNRFGRSLLKLKNKARSKSTIRIIPESELGSTAPNHVVDFTTS